MELNREVGARLPGAQALQSTPRKIDPEACFIAHAKWIKGIIDQEGAVGVTVPLSGTDSILTFLACAQAIGADKLGSVNLLGIHYGTSYPFEAPIRSICDRLGLRNFEIKVVDLQKSYGVPVDSGDFIHDEYLRWAHAQSDALARQHKDADDPVPWLVMGTRNRTERLLFKYSIASQVAVVEPLINLFKSEVLKICEHLGVPDSIRRLSRCSDNQCGRPGVMAENIEHLDHILMVRAGMLDANYLGIIPTLLRRQLERFVDETLERRGFMGKLPYQPPASIIESPS